MTMSKHITEDELNASLEAWYTARETALREQVAWGTVLQSHKTLIKSLRENGHSWEGAEREFDQISKGHAETLLAHWRNMDRLCAEYQALRKQFLDQRPSR